MPKNTVSAILLTTLASSAVTAGYQPINPLGLEGACFLLRIINNSNQTITISLDGVIDNDILFTDTTLNLPSQLNSQPNNQTCLFPIGQRIYVKGTNGTGNVYLAGYYQK